MILDLCLISSHAPRHLRILGLIQNPYPKGTYISLLFFFFFNYKFTNKVVQRVLPLGTSYRNVGRDGVTYNFT